MIQAFETKLYVGKDSATVNVKLYNDVSGSVVTLTVIFTGPKAKPNIVNQVSCSGFYQLDKMCSTLCTVHLLIVDVAGEECEANSLFLLQILIRTIPSLHRKIIIMFLISLTSVPIIWAYACDKRSIQYTLKNQWKNSYRFPLDCARVLGLVFYCIALKLGHQY